MGASRQIRSLALFVGGLVTGGVVSLAMGCGSNEASAAWIRQADRLCDKANDRYAKSSYAEFEEYSEVRTTIRNERALASRLRGLRVPQGEGRSVEQLARLLDRQSDELEQAMRIHARLGTGSIYQIFKQHLVRAEDLTAAIKAAALSFGAKACAQPPIPPFYI